jgi:beta-lactam-binding protein with PASTA domain
VVGKTEEVAKALLQNAGFTNIVTESSDEQGEPGEVVAQTPDAKQKRSKGTKIILTVIAEPAPDPTDTEEPDPTDTEDPPIGGIGGTGEDGPLIP